MAAPTEVFVESTSITSATIIWTYPGSATVSVWRAPNGGAFAKIAEVVVGITTYTDNTAETGVFYDYKLSDNNGATFSSVVSVVIQVCPFNSGSTQSTSTIALPRPQNDEELTAKYMENILAQIEAQTNTQAAPRDCNVCIVNGAQVIDCSNGCFNFSVVVDQDVNSISINGCENGNIDWSFPPNTTRRVCGWPAGMGFLGGECKNNPVVSGANGRRMSSPFGPGKMKPSASKKGYPLGGGGGGAFGSNCPCSPSAESALRITCCTIGGQCSLNCSSATGKKLKMKICGGTGPYTMSHTGSVKLSPNADTRNPVLGDALIAKSEGAIFWVVPPANTGSGVAGSAYQITGFNCNVCFTTTCSAIAVNKKIHYGCNDQVIVCGDSSTGNICSVALPAASSMTCSGTQLSPCAAGAGKTCQVPQCPDAGFGPDLVQSMCDARTAPMIAAGCSPCGLNAGATVSVTDSLGVTATIILRGN